MNKLSRNFLTLFLDVDESVDHSLVTADILATVWWNYFYILPKDWNCLIRGWCNLVVDVCALTLAKAINTRVLKCLWQCFLVSMWPQWWQYSTTWPPGRKKDSYRTEPRWFKHSWSNNILNWTQVISAQTQWIITPHHGSSWYHISHRLTLALVAWT